MKPSIRPLFIIGAFAVAGSVYASPPAAASPELISADAHPDWVHVPGELIRPDCIHEIPKGARVENNGDITVAGEVVAHYDRCPDAPIKTHVSSGPRPAFADSIPGAGTSFADYVQADVSLKSGDNISNISSYWTVPQNPTENGGLFFLWNGIEPPSEGVVLQSVLQWGVAGTTSEEGPFGGNYWVIAGWLAHGPTGNAYHSPGERVNPGDIIHGETSITSTTSSQINWKVDIKDITSGVWSYLDAWSTGDQWTVAFAGALETGNITSCTQLPMTFYDLFYDNVVQHDYPTNKAVTPSWEGYTGDYLGPECGYTALVDPEGKGNYLYW
jgi:hypothetical protein